MIKYSEEYIREKFEIKEKKREERDKKIKENNRLYHRNWARDKRASEKENKINNGEVKENIIPSKELKVRPEYPRQEYMKNYHRKKSGFQEPKIKDLVGYIKNIKKYPINFPESELNKEFNKIVKCNQSGILEKKLKDVIYDILDKKGILSPAGIIHIYNNPIWTNAIEKFMSERNYSKNGDDSYVHTEK